MATQAWRIYTAIIIESYSKVADFLHNSTKWTSGILVLKELKGIITDEYDISRVLITKSISSGKTKVLDRKQMKILDYINCNPQNVGVEISLKDDTLLGLKKKIGPIHIIDKKIYSVLSQYAGAVQRSDWYHPY